ncbi:Spherulation-specific family 4-domain-containing protein [Xylariaceae sp. AK1471]|nr:Spherulation-specific family 4-domain-containing protein [Xylariaceae sp. AK1471]
MALLRVSALLASMAASVSATGILLPLYLYPSAEFNDGAANWKPAFDAMAASAHVPWLVVVNPANGPGPTGEPGNGDPNYISGVSQLNALSNVQTIGYVRTDYGASPLAELEANITNWANWSSFSSSSENTGVNENIGVDGIFFDEASASGFEYLNSAIAYARTAFGSKQIVTICNFGGAAPAEYYGICDVAIAFESFLNNPDFPVYMGQTTLDANIPAGNYDAQAAVIVHDFTGAAYDGKVADVTLLNSYVQFVRDFGLGWVYFCSGGYDSITTAPATIGALAAAF